MYILSINKFLTNNDVYIIIIIIIVICFVFFIICRRCSAQYLYWASEDIPDNPSERINNVEFLYERQFHPNVGNAVMATSYALLCYLAHNDMKDSVPIMKFITSQRNHLMGWSSTSVRLPDLMHSVAEVFDLLLGDVDLAEYSKNVTCLRIVFVKFVVLVASSVQCSLYLLTEFTCS